MEFKIKKIKGSLLEAMLVYSETDGRYREWGEIFLSPSGLVHFSYLGPFLRYDELAEISKFVSHLQVFRPWEQDGGAEW